ncbi:trehalose 6-phosphate synthase, partial [bacterium]|nr:trehalose 6-phosphate synthase [bacterium]
YELIRQTRDIKYKIVKSYFARKKISTGYISFLKTALKMIENIKHSKDGYALEINNGKIINSDFTYEIEELKKDIYYLENGERKFHQYLKDITPGYEAELNKGIEIFSGKHYNLFVADRDGTINNYCGRYNSSVQSVYNAIFLTQFARKCTNNSIIITSAPLENTGLREMSIFLEDTFILAGSKGREYYDNLGVKHCLTISNEKQNKLDIVNNKLLELVKRPEYEIFSLVGSGLQFKFGQTTIARQDINRSISKSASEKFRTVVEDIVSGADPSSQYLKIEDTGKDIEIILTISENGEKTGVKDFDKGDGIKYIIDQLKLDFRSGSNLICGDTISDVPLLKASMEFTENTYSIFVLKDKELKEKVRNICPNSFFVSSPDILITLLNNISIQEGLNNE